MESLVSKLHVRIFWGLIYKFNQLSLLITLSDFKFYCKFCFCLLSLIANLVRKESLFFLKKCIPNSWAQWLFWHAYSAIVSFWPSINNQIHFHLSSNYCPFCHTGSCDTVLVVFLVETFILDNEFNTKRLHFTSYNLYST